MTRVGVVIPAFDEELALPSVLAELPRARALLVVVVDNGSRDRTAEVARAAGASVVREEQRGYGAACQAGVGWLLDGAGLVPPLADDDLLVFLDADHSDYPEDLERLLAPLLAGEAELVLGSRILGGASWRALLPQAWLGNRLACGLMRVLFGARYTDLGPFRALRVGALRRLGMADRGFGWTIEMQLKARSLGLRVVEVPVRYRARIGRSKITGTLAGTLRAGAEILGWILAWRVRTWLRKGSIGGPVGAPHRGPAQGDEVEQEVEPPQIGEDELPPHHQVGQLRVRRIGAREQHGRLGEVAAEKGEGHGGRAEGPGARVLGLDGETGAGAAGEGEHASCREEPGPLEHPGHDSGHVRAPPGWSSSGGAG
jgi:hypothetical protein